jgi:D5 N terminal like
MNAYPPDYWDWPEAAQEEFLRARDWREKQAKAARGGNSRDEAACQTGERFTDLGNARRLVRVYGNDIRFVAAFNAWFIWEGHCWGRDEDGAIMRRAKESVEKLFHDAANVEDETLKTTMRKFALASQHCARLAAMVKVAESELPVVLSFEKLDGDLVTIS